MKILALIGSLALFIYIVVVAWLTSVNISKHFFAEGGGADLFLSRQATILLWPLMLISEEGCDALAAIWNKEPE